MTTNRELEDILKQFAEWTIKNVEHGIFIPLPSPETEHAIKDHFHQALLSGLPEKQSEGYGTNGLSGTNYVGVGFNQALDLIEQLINKVFNKEKE